MKAAIKRIVSFVLVFVLVFSVFTILPGELFRSFAVRAAETAGAVSRSVGKAVSEIGSKTDSSDVGDLTEHEEDELELIPEENDCEHDFVLTGTEPATCTEPERDIYTCSKCGETKADPGRLYDLDPSKYFESEHPYANNTDISWTLEEPGASYYEFTFGEDCKFESGDYLTFYNYKGVYVTSVSDPVPYGKTVRVDGPVCRVRFITDSSDRYYGFRFESIRFRREFEPLGHDYVETAYKQPTCTEKGERTFRCTRCGEEMTTTGYDVVEDKAQYPHSEYVYGSMDQTWFYTKEGADHFDLVFDEDSYASSPYAELYIYDKNHEQLAKYTGSFGNQTLTVPGDSFYVRLKCSHNGSYHGFAFEKITTYYEYEPAGHNYELIESVAPTCTENGRGTYRCSVCGDVVYDEGEDAILDRSEYPESPHNYGNNVDMSWELSHPGTNHLTFKLSGQSFLENNYDKLYFYDSKGNLAATLTGSIGGRTVTVEGSYCRIRLTTDGGGTYYGFSFDAVYISGKFGATGHSFTEYVPEEGHTATCTDSGTAVAICDNGCGATDTRSLAAVGHSFTNYVDDGNATCTSNGTKTAVCDNGCGAKNVKVVPAFGHDWDEGTVTPSTCCERGNVLYTCRTCSATRTEYLAYGRHSYSEEFVPATCTDDAYYTYTCENCGDSFIMRDGRLIQDSLPESPHDYENGKRYSRSLQIPIAQQLVLTFSEESSVELNHDFVYVYDGEGELAGKFTGKLSSQSCTVNGNSFTIKMTTDGEGTDYGFALSSVVAKRPLPKALGHSFTDEAAGDAANTVTHTCERCGYSYTTADAPAKIDNVVATPSETNITLAWQISKEADTEKYRLYRKAEGENAFTLYARINGRSNRTYTDSAVEFGKEYSYYVVGVDKYGQESETYDIVSASLIPDVTPPVFKSMTPSSNSAISGIEYFSISATDNVQIENAELFYSTDSDTAADDRIKLESQNGALLKNQRIDTTVMPDGYVFVWVKLTDTSGNSSWSPAYRYLCDNTGPEKVKNFRVTAVGGTTATLAWDDVSDNDVSYFLLEIKQQDGSWNYLSTISHQLGYNLMSLTPETSYTYRVAAYDSNGNRGTESDELTVTTTADTIAPKVTAMSPAPGYYRDSIYIGMTVTDDYRIAFTEIQVSGNNRDWSTVKTIMPSNEERPSYTIYYSLDLTGYEEGPLFVRGIVEDRYGNRTPDDETTTYEYEVDRTAPALPTGIKADSSKEGSGSFVCVSWNAVTNDSSFAYYRVYRSDSPDGEYTLIKNNVTTVNIYDTGVDFGGTYYYRLESVDKAGNVSEKSAPVSCTVIEDTEPPVILPVSPSDGTKIGSRNNSISVAATDNAKVKTIKAEYKTNAFFSDYQTLKEITGNNSSRCSFSCALPLDEFGNGTQVTLRITASDTAGNEAEEKLVTYTIDTEAPQVENVSLSGGENNNFTSAWSCNSDDVSHFYIYRKTDTATSFTLYDSVRAQAGKTDYSYTDDDVVPADKSVQYRIEAQDAAGNTSFADTEILGVAGATGETGATAIAPIALLDCQGILVCESEYIFDGSHSSDDGTVVSYRIDFGDGSEPVENTNGKARHIYTETGMYTVTLTVTDNDGNVGSTQKNITVTGREMVGNVTVTVKDDNGAALPGTDIYVDLGEDNALHAFADSAGAATFELSIGTHVIAAYKDSEHLPVKQSITVTGSDTTLSLVLINEPIVTGEFEIHRMTFEEIIAAGIDITAAQNRNVVRLDVTLQYERVPIKSVIYWNGQDTVGEPIYVKSSSGVSRKLTPHVFGGSGSVIDGSGSGSSGGSGGSGGSGSGSGSGSGYNTPTIVYVDVPVEFSYLKEFFDVSLHIINHASEDFSLLNNTVKLNVPDGLSIVKTNSSEPKASVYIDEIKGQSQCSIEWVLRGDAPGNYRISADFLGLISYFNEPVSATFIADDDIVVYGSTGIEVEIEACETSKRGKLFFNTVVKNKGPIPLNAFEWKPLIESYMEEFVDANGNVSEMDEQRDTLNPGEKFVYRYFTGQGAFKKYVGYMVDDLNASGAEVTVTIHPVSYFLPQFYEKFPEESGSFVFEIVDSSGDAIDGAQVELSSDVKLKADDPKQKGRVIIPEDERDTIECDYLRVTADGYYSYTDPDFEGVAHGKKETVKLYRVGEFAVESVTLDGKDVINYSSSIQTNKDEASATFVAKIYGEIKSVDIVQGGRVLSPSTSSYDASRYTYTRVIPANSFENGKPISLRVIEKEGKERNIALNIIALELDTDIDVKLPDNMSAELGSDDEGLSWLNGINLSLDFTDKINSNIEYDRSEQTISFMLNYNLRDFNTADPDDFNFDECLDADVFEKKLTKFMDQIDDSSDDIDKRVTVGIGGVIAFHVNDDGTLGDMVKARAFLKVEGSLSAGSDFIVGVIPLTINVNISLGVSGELGFEREKPEDPWEFNAKVGASLEVEASLGIGISCLNFSFYDSMNLETAYIFGKECYLDDITLKGEFGFSVKFFWWSKKYPILTAEVKVYNHEANTKKRIMSALSDSYVVDGYEIDSGMLNYGSVWNAPVKASSSPAVLLENAYAGTAPQIARAGDRIIMVYQGIDPDADCAANALALYYSVYDAATESWSTPSKLDNNHNADLSYSLASCGDRIAVVYTQSAASLTDEASLEDSVKNIEVYGAVYDPQTNAFTENTRITSNSSFDANPVLKNIGGAFTAAWINSAGNNPFLNDDGNTVMTSSLTVNGWTAPEAVADEVKTPSSLTLIGANGSGKIAYMTDSDNDLTTSGDRQLIVSDIGQGGSAVLAEGIETDIEAIELNGKDVLVWYENGSMKQYDPSTDETSEIIRLSNSAAGEFRAASDENGNTALVFKDTPGSLSAVYFNSASGEWTAPVRVVSSENFIDSFDAAFVNGKLSLTYYDTVMKDSETLETESSLMTVTVGAGAKPVISSADVDLNEVRANEEARLLVKVENDGFTPTGDLEFTVTGYDGSVIGAYSAEASAITGGGSKTYSVPFTAPDTALNRDLKVTVSDGETASEASFTLAKVDMGIRAEQYDRDGQSFVKATVYNNYLYASPATVEIYNRLTGETLNSVEISTVYNGKPAVIYIPLDASCADVDGLVSVRVVSKAPDSRDFNNTCAFAYRRNSVDDTRILIGDLNFDGLVNIIDATIVQKIAAKIIVPDSKLFMAADADGDNDIDINDVTAIQKRIAKLSGSGLTGTSCVYTETEDVQDNLIKVTAAYAYANDGQNNIRFEFKRNVLDSYTMLSHGVLYGTSASTFGGGKADAALRFADSEGKTLMEKVKNTVITTTTDDGTDGFTIDVGSRTDGVVYARAYAILEDSKGSVRIVYSDVISGSFDELK